MHPSKPSNWRQPRWGWPWAQIKAQQSLAESEARYRLIFDHPNDAMFITDSDGNILEANQEACDRLGFSKEELCTKSMRGIAIPDSTVDEQQLMQQLAEKKRVCFETSHRRRDGSIIPTEIVARQIEFNGKTACLCAARDISVRKEAEARIREQAALFGGGTRCHLCSGHGWKNHILESGRSGFVGTAVPGCHWKNLA